MSEEEETGLKKLDLIVRATVIELVTVTNCELLNIPWKYFIKNNNFSFGYFGTRKLPVN